MYRCVCHYTVHNIVYISISQKLNQNKSKPMIALLFWIKWFGTRGKINKPTYPEPYMFMVMRVEERND